MTIRVDFTLDTLSKYMYISKILDLFTQNIYFHFLWLMRWNTFHTLDSWPSKTNNLRTFHVIFSCLMFITTWPQYTILYFIADCSLVLIQTWFPGWKHHHESNGGQSTAETLLHFPSDCPQVGSCAFFKGWWALMWQCKDTQWWVDYVLGL